MIKGWTFKKVWIHIKGHFEMFGGKTETVHLSDKVVLVLDSVW